MVNRSFVVEWHNSACKNPEKDIFSDEGCLKRWADVVRQALHNSMQ